MNEKYIYNIRRKFIFIGFLSFTMAMLLMGGIIYGINAYLNRMDVKNILQHLTETQGDFTKHGETGEEENTEDEWYVFVQSLFSGKDSPLRAPEFIRSTRFFVLTLSEAKEVESFATNAGASFDEAGAKDYALLALQSGRSFGKYENYFFQVTKEDTGSYIIAFVDNTERIVSSYRILFGALLIVAVGAALSFFLLRLFSNYIVRTELENMERQKQFITNAGHELKTPLAVIRANTELEMMLNGENEWNTSTLRQIDHMTGLIKNLVLIAKAGEKEGEKDVRDVDVSALLEELSNTFLPLAIQAGKSLENKTKEKIVLRAEESDIRQLLGILLDNAIKYCDDKGQIVLEALRQGKGIRLRVSNSYTAGKEVDYRRFFERFYREDESHNIDKGGYGIGLAIAEALVKQYGGSIDVSCKNEVISFECVLRNLEH